MFGVIVTFWPIYLLAISIASCYSKCFKEEEDSVKNFKAKYKLSNSPTIGLLEQNVIHSPSKCLAWVKKCCHVWVDQNFDLSLLTNKL